jgi:hypothetical protein
MVTNILNFLEKDIKYFLQKTYAVKQYKIITSGFWGFWTFNSKTINYPHIFPMVNERSIITK